MINTLTIDLRGMLFHKNFPGIPVYTTWPTRDIIPSILQDTAKLSRMDITEVNDRNVVVKKGNKTFPVRYTDIKRVISRNKAGLRPARSL